MRCLVCTRTGAQLLPGGESGGRMLRWLLQMCLTLALTGYPASLLAADAGRDIDPLDVSSSPHRPALLFEAYTNDADGAFIDMARKGAARARKELGVKFDEYTIAAGENREHKLEAIAQTRAQLIVAVGFENADAIDKVAARHKDIHFVLIDGQVSSAQPNVQSIVFKDQEGAFLVGMIAASMSKSGILGFVGGMDAPVIRSFLQGYTHGGRYVRRDIHVIQATIGDTSEAWSNHTRAGMLARQQVEQGADVIFAAAGGAGTAALKVAHEEGVFAIGVDTNQNGLYPGTVITSLVKRVDLAVHNVLTSYREGIWEPGTRHLSAAEGFLDYAVDRHNRGLLPKELIDRVEEARDLMLRGKLIVRVDSR